MTAAIRPRDYGQRLERIRPGGVAVTILLTAAAFTSDATVMAARMLERFQALDVPALTK